jgi:hypothetical protein
MKRIGALAFALVVAACHRGHDAGLYCGTLASAGSSNPLLEAGRYFCFDDKGACTARARDCAAVGEPSWACFATEADGTSKDPLVGMTECFPARAMCEASRPRHLGARYHASECAAADAVYCRTNDHNVACTESEHDCELVRDFEASVLHDHATACTRR